VENEPAPKLYHYTTFEKAIEMIWHNREPLAIRF